MREILLATRNEGKAKEFQKILGNDFKILTLADTDLPEDFDIEEPGTTYEAHAAIKAMTAGVKTGMLTMADDTGIEVDALNGRPGVFSARYAQNAQARNEKMLKELEGVEDRGAQFCIVLAVFDPATFKIRFIEVVERGQIAMEVRGDKGFGYDSLFIPDGGDGRVFAEMEPEEKMKISHRGLAAKQIPALVKEEF